MESPLTLQTRVEYFRELVKKAAEETKIPINEITEFYLVLTLVHASVDSVTSPIGERFLRAQVVPTKTERIALLRSVGDSALLIVGFWPDFVQRRQSLVNFDYYIGQGQQAYRQLCDEESGNFFTEVYQELAHCFVPVATVINAVREKTSVIHMADILKMYERWQSFHDQRSAAWLAKRGISVVDAPKRKQ